MADIPRQALVRGVPASYVGYYARQNRVVDGVLAGRQHQQYADALAAAGLTVAVVPADESLADCVFIEDTAVVWSGQVLMTRMCEAREGEQAAVENVLQATHSIVHLPSGATLDGGDVLHVGDVSYVGLSSRTNQAGAAAVREFLGQFGRTVISVPVRHCLHLKTGVTCLGPGTLLAVPDWFDMRHFEVDSVIYTAPGEQRAANCLRIRDHLLIPAGYPETARQIQAFAATHGLHVTRLCISEFETGDGSLTCLSLIW